MRVVSDLLVLQGYANGAAGATDDVNAHKAFLHIAAQLKYILAELETVSKKVTDKMQEDLEKLEQEFAYRNASASAVDIGLVQEADILAQPVEELPLAKRTINALIRDNIFTLGDLVTRSESHLLGLRDIGRRGHNDIKEIFLANGLSFAKKED